MSSATPCRLGSLPADRPVARPQLLAARLANRPLPGVVAVGEVPCPGWAAVGVREVEGEPRLGQMAVEAVVGERRPELGSLHLASEEGVAAWPAQASRWSQAPG